MNSNNKTNNQLQAERELELLKKKKEQIQAQWEQVKQYQMVPPPQNASMAHMQQNSHPRGGTHQSRKRDWFLRHKRQFFDANGAKKPRKSEKKQEDYVLTEDCEPSIKLQGRLELGLGHILKEMKSQFPDPPYDVMFIRGESIKAIKFELRDRIRKIMMGKNVSGLEFLLETYRQAYPLTTDKQLLDEIKVKLERQSEVITAQAADLLVVKRYIGEKMDIMLDDIFKKVTKMYDEERKAEEDQPMEEEENNATENTDNGNNDNGNKTVEEAENVKKCVTEEQIAEVLKTAPLDEAKLMQFMRTKLHVLLPTYTSYIKRILFGDKSFVDFVMQAPNHINLNGYHVRILGRPTLPKKNSLLHFLRDYSLISMKRHKEIANLVNVCVASEKDMKSLLEYNNGDIEDTVLLMRPHGEAKVVIEEGDNGTVDVSGLEEFNNDDNSDDFFTDMEEDYEEEEEVANE